MTTQDRPSPPSDVRAALRNRLFAAGVSAVLLAGSSVFAQEPPPSFVNFESGQVRPIALSPDGTRLYVANTPDNRLEIFDVTDLGLSHRESVPVGLEPVALGVSPASEVWVVNHLSDSISIVSDGPRPGGARVRRTLLVGDEPRDIVFAGPDRSRAFITTAHRGQHSPFSFDPDVIEGRADVWVFDVNDTDEPLTVLQLFGDTPRPLAVSADGDTVYAGIFKSGNRSTIVRKETVFGRIGDPAANVEGVPAPTDIGLIVQQGADGRWLDGQGTDWSEYVRVELPDYDVFAIDASAPVPVETGRIEGVGTTVFNMTATPDGDYLLVSNLEARNVVRFEGFGEIAPSTVRGHFIENRISLVDLRGGNQVLERHLNKHIDYDRELGTQAENDASLATPLQMAVTGDGSTVYVAAFGSGKIGIFDLTELAENSFTPSPGNHIEVSGGGPSGLVLDETRQRLYVLTRFNNAVVTVDLELGEEVDSLAMYSPEPPVVTQGRRFLYDARDTSSRGDSSCAGCHIFGDTDHLAWDLGNPDATVLQNRNPFRTPVPDADAMDFHPMKGPMATQSLRGMANHGPMHWRGDRSGANDPEVRDAFDEIAAFKAFNEAFRVLLAREDLLRDEQMQAFAEFALSIHYPPNPIRALDNRLTPDQAAGRQAYFNVQSDGVLTCNGCHVIDLEAGFFGSDGQSAVRRINPRLFRQALKVPHLRNMYTKVGFFGTSRGARENPPPPGTGEQIRGFGYLHDATEDTLLDFLAGFTLESDQQREQVVDFIMAMDAELLPVVGQQVTIGRGDLADPAIRAQLTLLLARSQVTQPREECDLIVKGVWGDEPRGAQRAANGAFRTDRAGEGLLGLPQLLALSQAPGQFLTFTCVPPGSGVRMGIDRDEDGILDADEAG